MRPIDLRALQGASASLAGAARVAPLEPNKAAQALKLLFERCRRLNQATPALVLSEAGLGFVSHTARRQATQSVTT
jgi:hypothetical protein